MTTLAQLYDCLLLDLDGTVYRGHAPTAGAADALADSSARALFVTNNASNSPADVACRLREIGFPASSEDVVTSAQSAAALLAEQLEPGAKVLVVGTTALVAEIASVGLTPVRTFRESPAAVVQGHSPETDWTQLCEAALAIRAGAVWIATNLDATLPSERGLVPGNGSMVAAVATATERAPQVAGKPTSGILHRALSRGRFESPLVVGDRLDTDIAGAIAAGLPSLLVLTGASSASDAVSAEPGHRPTYIARDLRGLHHPVEAVAVAAHPAWLVEVGPEAVTVTSTGADPGADGLSVVRATAHALWCNGVRVDIRPGDDAASVALHRWSLLPERPWLRRARARSTSARGVGTPEPPR